MRWDGAADIFPECFYCTALSVQCLPSDCHVWKMFAVRFHVTSQVTNQTGCVKEKHLSSPSEALMKSFRRRHVFEWKPCNSNSCHGSQTFFFLTVRSKNFICSQFCSSPNEPVKSHIPPASRLEVKISWFPRNWENKCHDQPKLWVIVQMFKVYIFT